MTLFPFPDDELEMFARQVRTFAANRLAPHYQAGDREGRVRPQLVTDLAEMGLVGLRVDERFGGQGASCVATGIACEEVGRADLNATYLIVNAVLTAEIVRAGGSEEQQRVMLPPVAAGEVIPAICLTEPEHGSDAATLELRAERDGDGWRLTGEKTSITFGTDATTAVVLARTGGDGARGVTAFYLPLDDRYLERSAFSDLGGRSIGRASMHFDGHPASDDHRVGPVGRGFVDVMKGFDYSRALIGLSCLGAAQASLQEALEYATQRKAFGQPISSFQGVSFPLVELLTQVRGARLLCFEALARRDAGLDHATEANMAKWWAPKLAVEAAHQALLTFGHVGYSDELPLGQRMRDIVGLEIGDGTAQIAKLVVARHLLGRDNAP